ncbi:MAG: hypothetical protein ABIR96_03755 [Bdellovibrionota bacterium]
MEIKRTVFLLMVIALGLWMVGCATPPATKLLEDRSFQTQIFKGASYNTVFRAVVNVLQNEGSIVNQEEKGSGRLVARIEKPDALSSPNDFTALVAEGDAPSSAWDHRRGEGYEVALNVDPIDDKIVEVRMTIQKVEFYNEGGARGSVMVSEEGYTSLFDKVRLEIKRQNAKEHV